MAVKAPSFFEAELAHQTRWRERSGARPDEARRRGERFLADWRANIWPGARADVEHYVRRHKLKMHTMAAHLLSSQIFCFNFLAPFMSRPSALADLLRPIVGGEVVPIWLPGEESFVAFEWISTHDYLNEGEKRQRGSQCTSVDAAVGYVTGGRRELLLLEWKYTESYGAPLADRPRARSSGGHPTSNEVRTARYRAHFDAGVVTPEFALDDLFWEPFYQLLRQQMLARAVEADTERPEAAFDRVSLAHVSPSANRALQKLTAPKVRSRFEADGLGACEAWRRMLLEEDRYRPIHVETLFRGFPFDRRPELSGWGDYMKERYAFLA